MPISKSLLVEKEPPQTQRGFEIIRTVLDAELRDKLMVFVPSHRRKYFNRKFIDERVLSAFPGPHRELRSAGQCFAVELYTASVFHAMRAVEVGLRLMADELEVTLVEGIENAQWETLIRQIEAFWAVVRRRFRIKHVNHRPRAEGRIPREQTGSINISISPV